MPTIFALLQVVFVLLTLFQADSDADFSGLGRKMLAGFVVAIIVAVGLALIKFRLRDKKPSTQFISITSAGEKDTATE